MTTELLMTTYAQSRDAEYEAALALRSYTQIKFEKVFPNQARPSIFVRRIRWSA